MFVGPCLIHTLKCVCSSTSSMVWDVRACVTKFSVIPIGSMEILRFVHYCTPCYITAVLSHVHVHVVAQRYGTWYCPTSAMMELMLLMSEFCQSAHTQRRVLVPGGLYISHFYLMDGWSERRQTPDK